jgi:hypothetical protein
MDWRKAEELIEKYWNGETSIEEEMWLKEHRDLLTGSENGRKLERLFEFWEREQEHSALGNEFDEQILQSIGTQEMAEDRKVISIFQKLRYWPIAAAMAIIIAAGIAIKSDLFKPSTEDTFEDPREAFEATKVALLLVSEKLNEGKAQAARIQMISDIEQNLKSAQK